MQPGVPATFNPWGWQDRSDTHCDLLGSSHRSGQLDRRPAQCLDGSRVRQSSLGCSISARASSPPCPTSVAPAPSRPILELLDYLADGFVKSGWDVKQLHRQILLSSVYRQSSDYRPDVRSRSAGSTAGRVPTTSPGCRTDPRFVAGCLRQVERYGRRAERAAAPAPGHR